MERINIVINFSKCTPTSITASNRIAKWIANLTGSKLVDELFVASHYLKHNNIGTAFVVNGMFGFSDFKKEIVQLCDKAERIIWIGNDYAIQIPSQMKHFTGMDKFYRIAQYSNFDNLANHQMVDFNKLTFEKNVVQQKYKYGGLFYYGALRKGRNERFNNYLKQNENLAVSISTSRKNQSEFKKINNNATMFLPMPDIIQGMQYFQASVYIEDELKKPILLTPANRFYECLSAKILLLYDKNSKETLKRAGFYDSIFEVTCQEDVIVALEAYDELRNYQQKLFNNGTQDYKEQLKSEFLNAIKTINLVNA